MISTRTLVLFLGALLLTSLPAFAQDRKKSIDDLSKQVQKAVDAGKEEEALAKVKELSGLSGEEKLPALFELGIKIQLPKVYKAITEVLAGMTDDATLAFFETEAKGQNEVRRIYTADVLGLMKHPRAVEILALLAEEKDSQILRATIENLARQRVRGSVPPLLKVLERLDLVKDRGQVYQELRDALFEVTGQDFETLADWKKWWEPRQENFEPGKKGTGGTETRKASRDAAPEFAGKKIFGKNVVFVIDTSGTMQYVMKDDIPGLVRADGSDFAGGGEDPEEQGTNESMRLAKFWTRMEMVKRALIRAVEKFDQKARCNIIQFNSKVKPMGKSLITCSPDGKGKAIKWVKGMKYVPNSTTFTQKALEEAFALDKSTTEIYFLTDGQPSKDGRNMDPIEPILERVEALNRFRKIKIYTFGFDPVSISEGMEHPGLVTANEFLKKLARRTGGTFTMLKVTDEKPPKTFR